MSAKYKAATKRQPAEPVAIGMTGYCHRGDHEMCPHTEQPADQWWNPDHPSCACSCHKGPTGHCSSGNHTRCRYGLGREFPTGIRLSDGQRACVYMCPCECHAADQRRALAEISNW